MTYGIVFPLSLLKNMSSLRFTSVLGFVCICYISLLVFVEYFIVTTDIPANWGRANVFQVSIRGIFGSFPLIIFSFLYQPNIPAIYTELKHKSLQRMDKVLVLATIISVSIYVLVGIFGYVTFADLPVEMEKVNILAATPYMKRVEAQIVRRANSPGVYFHIFRGADCLAGVCEACQGFLPNLDLEGQGAHGVAELLSDIHSHHCLLASSRVRASHHGRDQRAG